MNKLMPLLTILFMFTLSSVIATENTHIYNHNELGQVTVTTDVMNPTEFFIKSGLSNLKPFAISISPAAPVYGDRVSVTWFGATNDCNIQQAFIVLQKKGESDFFDYYFVPEILGGSISASVTVDFQNAPPVGEYDAKLIAYDSSNQICFSESKQFLVSADTVICPNDYCESWSIVFRDDHGTVYQRTCYEYSGDSCIENTDYETKLICDDGYIKQGNSCVADTDNGDGAPGAGNGTTTVCQNIQTITEYCACYPATPSCLDNGDDENIPWYLMGYNFYYILGSFALIIVVLLVTRNGGKRR